MSYIIVHSQICESTEARWRRHFRTSGTS